MGFLGQWPSLCVEADQAFNLTSFALSLLLVCAPAARPWPLLCRLGRTVDMQFPSSHWGTHSAAAAALKNRNDPRCPCASVRCCCD